MFPARLGALARAATTLFAPPAAQGQPLHLVRPALAVLTDFPAAAVEHSPASETADELATPASVPRATRRPLEDREDDGDSDKENVPPPRHQIFSPTPYSDEDGDSDKENVPPPRYQLHTPSEYSEDGDSDKENMHPPHRRDRSPSQYFEDGGDEGSDKENAPPPRHVDFSPVARAAAQRAARAMSVIDDPDTRRVFVPRRPLPRRSHSAPAALPIICPRPRRADPTARAAFLPEPNGPPARPVHKDFTERPKLLSYEPGARLVCRDCHCHCHEVMKPEYPAAVLLASSLALKVAYGDAAAVVRKRLRRVILDDDVTHTIHLLAHAWLVSGPVGRFELMREASAQIAATVLAYQRDMNDPVRFLSVRASHTTLLTPLLRASGGPRRRRTSSTRRRSSARLPWSSPA
jgi:hypothetical protein